MSATRPRRPRCRRSIAAPPRMQDARNLAHQFADDIVAVLSGGQPGIAQTQIAYVSAKSGNKEIWVMDYDGANQHQVTHLKSISLTPRWSPDATRIAFTCYVPYRGVYFGANLHLFDGVEPADCVSALPGNEQLARMVAGRLADRIHVQPERRSRNLRVECGRRRTCIASLLPRA